MAARTTGTEPPRDPKIKAVAPRLAPKLDVFLGGSDSVNRGRAEQSASVAAPPPTRRERAPVAREVETLTTTEVAKLTKTLPSRPESPHVEFSLFIQLDRDLDPDTRRRAIEAVRARATRVRWKLDTASVEMPAEKVKDLLEIPGISYVEPGYTLRGPEPTIGRTEAKAPGRVRHVPAQQDKHRHGKDVLIGVIDVGGFDFAHPDFLDDDGHTRWVSIWDQGGTTRPGPQMGDATDRAAMGYGSEILKSHMDAAIAAAPARRMSATSLEPQSQMAPGSHGTHVASIAAGRHGVARRAHLAGVLVALRPEDTEARSSFYDSTRIADAVEYLLEVATRLGDGTPIPLSINISLGTNGHAHDTSSTMARWIDNALATRGRCVTVAAGNAGQVEPRSETDRGFVLGRIHAGGTLHATHLRHELGWVVVGGEIGDYSENELELWYKPQDELDVEIKPPGGSWIGPVHLGERIRNKVLTDIGTVVSVHSEAYYPANGLNRVSVLLSPFFGPVADGTRKVCPVAPGEWRIRLTGVVVRDGRYDAWIERDDPRKVPGDKRAWHYPSFFAPDSFTDDRMINSLACAERVLAVANVDVSRNQAHETSSRGPTRDGGPKPDIAADGTNVVAARGFDRTSLWMEMTGTSMASPFVCGVAALMLAICPQLTSAQIQGIMRSTSAPLPGHDFAWRKDTGFGLIEPTACVDRTAVYKRMLGTAR
jgi:subtilisin family serine protease